MKELREQSSQRELGFTLLELMVSLLITTVVSLAAMQMYSTITRVSYDHHVRMETHVQAQAIMQTMGGELRILGNGVPFDQANFQIGENTLIDPGVTEPIIVALTTSSSVSFRLNETGEVALLTADFNPALSTEIFLTDTAGLQANDPIYLTNSVMSGEDGLYGVITAVDAGANSVIIDANYVVSPEAVFPMGSILEEVPIINYSISSGTISRDSGYGPVALGNNAGLSFEYLDGLGNVLALPLTNQVVIDSLRAIKVTITLTSNSLLKDGSNYTATVEQVFGLRNLNYLF